MADVKLSSRFELQDQVLFDGVSTYGPWDPPWFVANPDAVPSEFVLQRVVTNDLEGRPDNISALIYSRSDLWWILVAFNKVHDVLNWPRAGTTIKYPTASLVLQHIN